MTQNPRHISIANYTYQLPQDRIALYPLPDRDSSKLLIFKDQQIQSSVFSHIDEHLPGSALLVSNNTRVVQARMLFRKTSGAVIEIFVLEPTGAIRDIQLAFQEKRKSSWFCLVGNAKKWKHGPLAMKINDQITVTAHKGDREKDGYIINFEWDSDISFAEILEMAGKTPLPPYIGRKVEEDDKIRYQTIYANHSGSVAAPTAGLHFTDDVFLKLHQKNIETTHVTLHVGAGTFKPVSVATLDEHQMHKEQVIVSLNTLEKILNKKNQPLISVGTTSVRTLESLYWLGVKIMKGYHPGKDGFHIDQWEPYSNDEHELPTSHQSLLALYNFMQQENLAQIHGETSLIIAPGYNFKLVNILITNFHQPGSTLLLLVAAFCGPKWKAIYDYALKNDFRFLSYGDSCLLFGQAT